MSTLVLVGHGSPHDQQLLEPVYDHAEALRDTEPFETVRAAFVKGEPTLGDVMESIESGTVVVVPLFATSGYFAGTVIPRRLDAYRETLDVRYTPPVGTHGAMTYVVLRRIESVIDNRNGVGVALVGHGSERHPDSANAIWDHAMRIREHDEFEEVRAVFLEEAPLVDGVARKCTADRLVVVPLFMANGHHVREDIPKKIGLLNTSDKSETVCYTEPVGTHPAVAEIARSRAKTALERVPSDEPLRAGAYPQAGTTPTGGS